MRSTEVYQPAHLAQHLSIDQLANLQVKKVKQRGVRRKDNERAVAKNELAKAKAARRRKPDKTIDDFEEAGKNAVVDNDVNWVDFEERQLKTRCKELATQAFWKAQDKDLLKSVYKAVFPGIGTVEKDTKAAYIDAIKKFLKSDGAIDRINLQAAVGIDRDEPGSASAKRKEARDQFFSSSGASEIEEKYLKLPTVAVDDDDDVDSVYML